MDRLKTDLIASQKELQKQTALKDMQIQEKDKMIQEKEEKITEKELDVGKLNEKMTLLEGTISEHENEIRRHKENEERLGGSVIDLKDALKEAQREKEEAEVENRDKVRSLEAEVELKIQEITELQVC